MDQLAYRLWRTNALLRDLADEESRVRMEVQCLEFERQCEIHELETMWRKEV